MDWTKAYLNAKCHLDPFSRLATTDMGQNPPENWGLRLLFGNGGLGPHLTQSPMGCGPTSIPSGILMHLAVWPQQKWLENWGGAPPLLWGGGWVPIKHRVTLAEAYLRAKWHVDPSSHLATINISQKFGGSPAFWGGGLGLHLMQSALG